MAIDAVTVARVRLGNVIVQLAG
ncbi:unnamed protein product, partial [Didymodactylos carnosus]